MSVLILDVAGIAIKLIFLPAENAFWKEHIYKAIRVYYKPFLVSQTAHTDYHIYFREEKTQRLLEKKMNGNSSVFAFIYKINSRNSVETNYQISLSQFEFFLRLILQRVLWEKNGMILHASANEYQKKAMIFLGQSGAGKSTIIKLLEKKYLPLADDSIIMKRIKNVFYFYQTPFIEKNHLIKKTRTPRLVHSYFFIHKSSRPNIIEIEEADIMNRLLEQLWSEKKYLKKQMQLITDLIDRGSFYNIYFKKDSKSLYNIFQNNEKIFHQ